MVTIDKSWILYWDMMIFTPALLFVWSFLTNLYNFCTGGCIYNCPKWIEVNMFETLDIKEHQSTICVCQLISFYTTKCYIGNWNWKMKMEMGIGNWNWKLEFEFELEIGIGIIHWNCKLKLWIRIGNWNLEL